MVQPKHNPESFIPPPQDAEILPFMARHTEQQPAQFHIEKWLSLGSGGDAVAEAILTDVEADTDDEIQTRLKAAVAASTLFDHYDEICDADYVTQLLVDELQSSLNEGGSLRRKALRALMEVRSTQLIISPAGDIVDQLERLPLGDEELWQTLIKSLSE